MASTSGAGRDYLGPAKYCDLVMKGGITSGVVYPLAACELATSFLFKNVGGASAGAIAAVVTAAAEYRRRNGDPGGFLALESLPAEVGAPGRLVGLFQPDAGTRCLFYPLLACLLARALAARAGLRR